MGAVDLALSAVDNYFAEVPDLDNSPPMPTRPFALEEQDAKRRRVQDASGYVQLTHLPRKRTGRRLRRQAKLNKHVEAQMLTCIHRFQNLSPINAGNGKYYLSYLANAATATKYSYPFYMFDLTSLYQNQWGDGTVSTSAVPFTRLARNVAAPSSYIFDIQYGKTQSDNLADTWQMERAPYNFTSSNNRPYEKAMLDWADIRVGLWGAKTKPSSCEILLCRFPYENRHPSAWEWQNTVLTDIYPPPTGVAANASGSVDFAEFQKFWTAQVDRLLANPLTVRENGADQKGMKIVYRKVINFNPTATYETDTTGHQFTFKMFHDMNMICDYKAAAISGVQGDGIVPVDMGNPNIWPSDLGVSECHSFLRNKKSRLFLVIRGFTSALSTTNEDPNTAASFDIMVRRKITII